MKMDPEVSDGPLPNQSLKMVPGRVDVGGTVTARNIIIATGSVPFVPPGIPIDGKTVRVRSCIAATVTF